MTVKLTTAEFIKKAVSIQGVKYGYEKVVYLGNKIPVVITCKEHGDFEQRPDVHMRGFGCPSCSGLKKKTKEEFIADSIKVHGDKYKYGKVEYISDSIPVEIECRNGHTFMQRLNAHKRGQGCPHCSGKAKLTYENVFKRMPEIHGDKYTLVSVTEGGTARAVLYCEKHNTTFSPIVSDYVNKQSGCPVCGVSISKAEFAIGRYLEELGVVTVKYKLKTGQHLDLYSEEHHIGIEYNGLRWHSDQFREDPFYHKKKSDQAKSEGIRLIHIFEDEWIHFPDKVKNLLKTVFGKSLETLNARSLSARMISWKEASPFLEEYHLQGSGAPSEINIGLWNGNDLVSVMCFTSRGLERNETELIRFCSKVRINGGFSKLLTYFLRTHPGFKQIISFSENRWSEGNVYSKNGFRLVGETKPSYWWTKNKRRYHKRAFQHQYLKEKFSNYDSTLSEAENCYRNGYYRIWDCGKSKWILNIGISKE
ncbi:hypothetical protein D3C87_280250 [compost metagenome]